MRLKKARKYTKYRNNPLRGKKSIEWTGARDVKKRVIGLLEKLQIGWVKKSRIVCFRSTGAKTRAYARIWGLSKIWQIALKIPPYYIIEVISEKYDKLSEMEKDKILLHELTHIPRNFSGALVPHIRHGKRRFEDKVHELIFQYLKSR